MPFALRLLALAAALALEGQAARPPAGGEPAAEVPAARSHVFSAELIRVDLGRGSLTFALDKGTPKELEARVDEQTRIVRAGRVATLPELRAGERARVSCVDEAPGRHRATLVRLGPPPAAATSPRP